MVRNLKAGNIFSVPMEKKVSGTLAVGTLSFPLINLMEPQMRPALRIFLHSAQTAVGVALGAWLVKRFFEAPSDFSNEPLRELLKCLDMTAITGSTTEARIMATDIMTGEHIAFSSQERGLTQNRLIEYLLASSTLPGTFPLASIGSRSLTDAEVRTNFPITELEDMDIVFVFSYCGGLGQRMVPHTKREHETAMWDIAKAQINRYAHDAYERRRREQTNLTETVFIETGRPIQSLTIDSFNQEALERSMRLGWEIIEENIGRIGNALGRTLARKELA